MTTNIHKWVCVGKMLSAGESNDQIYKVFVEIKYDGKRLSITGVEGPKRNGDCRGSCGQIDLNDTLYCWNNDVDVERLARIWKDWHLNDTRAGCEHQRANWDVSEKIELVTYRLTNEALREQNSIKERCQKELKADGVSAVSRDERAILNLPWETFSAPDADSYGSGMYEVRKRETKSAGWVKPSEHPRGLLSKPCEVCGYEYGSAWLYEPVPQEVIDFLVSLPECEAPQGWS